MLTGGTLFQGFDGVGIGMRQAGITPLWGIEKRKDVAAVAERNSFRSIVADILDVDPAQLPRVDYLHASPPCTNASQANAMAKEGPLDLAFAHKINQFIEVIQPRVFTLENVGFYRSFQAFKIILARLEGLGYWVDVQRVNAADYQVPQTRRRLILRARRGAWLPALPMARPWTGWMAAIGDLIPTFPISFFSNWQAKRLPDHVRDSFLIGNGSWSKPVPGAQPAPTIMASHNQNTLRAFLIDSQNSRRNDRSTIRYETAPAMTVTASSGKHGLPRAFVGGQVVQLTPRAIARLQTFPDSYQLPEARGLACYGIGNAAPPRLMKVIYQQLEEQDG